MPRPTVGLIAILLSCSSASAQETQRGQAGSLREIIPGHYMFNSGDLNSGIIVTSEGVVVVDALDSESVARTEREAIASTIRQPVRFLVSSPYHNPFSKGNIAYADVWKIGHENYRTDLIRWECHSTLAASGHRLNAGVPVDIVIPENCLEIADPVERARQRRGTLRWVLQLKGRRGGLNYLASFVVPVTQGTAARA